jgi:hypothetical protein
MSVSDITISTNTPQVGYRAVFTQDLYGNTSTGLVSGSTVLDVGSNAQLLALLNPSTQYGNVQFLLYNNITITYSDNTTQTFSDCRCTNINGSVLSFGYGATTAGHSFPITLQTSNYAAISANPIKNGASLLSVTKTGLEVVFDDSKDVEQGLDVLDGLTNNRFNDTLYYLPRGTPS